MDNRLKTIFGILIFVAVVAIGVRECLTADGAVFMLAMLLGHISPSLPFLHHDFIIIWPSRLSSQIFPQLLPWISINWFGSHSRVIDALLYGVSLYGYPVAALLLTYAVLDRKQLIVFPILSYLFSTLMMYQFVISESNVMAYLFWLVLALLSRQHLSLQLKILLGAGVVLSLSAYNSYIFLAPMWTPYLIYHAKQRRSNAARFYWIAIITAVLYGYGVELRSTVHPIGPHMFELFLVNAIHETIRYKELCLAIMLFGLGVWATYYLASRKKFISAILLLIPAVTFIAALLIPSFDDYWASFKYMGLMLAAPFFFGVVFVLYEKGKIPDWLTVAVENGAIMNGALAVTLFMGAIQLAAAFQWHGYTQQLVQITETAKTPTVKLQDTYLARSFGGGPLMTWSDGGWSYAAQSVLFAPGPVKSVVVTGWHRIWWTDADLLTKSRKLWGGRP